MALAGPRARFAHLVSRGLQNNFADSTKRVDILDPRTGTLIETGRPTKSNFGEHGFTTYWGPDGVGDDELEDGFARIERVMLNRIRDVRPGRRSEEARASVINLFAIHMVRSKAFRTAHEAVAEEVRTETIPSHDHDPDLIKRFTRETGRPPAPGELSGIGPAPPWSLAGKHRPVG